LFPPVTYWLPAKHQLVVVRRVELNSHLVTAGAVIPPAAPLYVWRLPAVEGAEAEGWAADEAARLVEDEMGRTEDEEVIALLGVAAADEGRTDELVIADEAGRVDEVEGLTEEEITADEDGRVEETTEDTLEAEAEVVTGLAPDDLSIS